MSLDDLLRALLALAFPERWLCPLCCHVNDAAVGEFSAAGYCQSEMCADLRGVMTRRGFRPLPEIVQARNRGAEA